MRDGELTRRLCKLPCRSKVGVRLLPRRERPAEAAIRRALSQHALLLEHRQDALRTLQKRQRLRVVVIAHMDPRDALLGVLCLLLLKDDVDEELLQLLVCEVDAELLVAIHLERLEAENVQTADTADAVASSATICSC